MSRRAARIALGIVLVTGAAVRLAHYAALAGSAYPDVPRYALQTDLHGFLRWAETILAGDLLGRDTYHPHFDWMGQIGPPEAWYRWWGGKEIFHQAPLYAYLVAAGLWALGGSLPALMLLQLGFGAIQPLVVHAVARRVADERAGIVAAALTAVYGPFVFHQGVLLRDWIPPLVEPIALLLLLRAADRGRRADWALAGAMLGVSLLVREAALLLAPLALGWAAWALRRTPRRLPAALGAALLGLAAAVAPLVARNAAVGAPLLALSNRLAENIVQGNAGDAFPVGLVHPPSMQGILERSGGRLPAVVRETLATHHGDWRGLVALQWLKLRALIDPLEVPNNVAYAYGLDLSPVLRATAGYGLVVPLGLAGAVVAARATAAHGLLALHATTTLALTLLGVVVARYRLALVPVLLIYAGAGLVRAWDALRERDTPRLVAWGLALAATAALQHLVLPIGALRDREAIVLPVVDVLGSAEVYARRGDFPRAIDELARLRARAMERPEAFGLAVGESWRAEGGVRLLWATRLLEDGRPKEAARQIAEAEAAYGRGVPDPLASYNIGLLALRLGDRSWAAAAFGRFLVAAPEGPEAERARRWLTGRTEATR